MKERKLNLILVVRQEFEMNNLENLVETLRMVCRMEMVN